jgi:hypothetical protein
MKASLKGASVATALVVAVFALVGCSLGPQSYYMAETADGLTTCLQIDTTDQDVMDAAVAEGWLDGTCADDGGVSGDACVFTDGATFGTDTQVLMYFEGYDAATMAYFCALVGGTLD